MGILIASMRALSLGSEAIISVFEVGGGSLGERPARKGLEHRDSDNNRVPINGEGRPWLGTRKAAPSKSADGLTF